MNNEDFFNQDYAPGEGLADSNRGLFEDFERGEGRELDSTEEQERNKFSLEERLAQIEEWKQRYDLEVNPEIIACQKASIPDDAIKLEIFRETINNIPRNRLIGAARRLDPEYINWFDFDQLRNDICTDIERETKIKGVVERLRQLKDQYRHMPDIYS